MPDIFDRGLMGARAGVCRICKHWLAKDGRHWTYPRCDHSEPWRELEPGFTLGPEDNCPLGEWEGLKPLDLVDRATKAKEAAVERFTTQQAVVWRHIKKDQREIVLTEMIRAGQMTADLAERIMAKFEEQDAAETKVSEG